MRKPFYKNILSISNLFKFVGKSLQFSLISLSVLLATILFLSAGNNPFGLKAFSITSGSMEPSIKTGSLTLTLRSGLYRTGDIITFQQNSKKIITHRIIDKRLSANNELEYITKGDANEERDSAIVKESQIIGKEIFTAPYLGLPLLWAKSQKGYILLIVVPATIIIYSELLNIKTEIEKFFASRKRQDRIRSIADI